MKDQITKRLNNINTIMHHDGDTLIVGTDEWGKEFTIVFDTYDILEWIDIQEMKKSIIKHLNNKTDETAK